MGVSKQRLTASRLFRGFRAAVTNHLLCIRPFHAVYRHLHETLAVIEIYVVCVVMLIVVRSNDSHVILASTRTYMNAVTSSYCYNGGRTALYDDDELLYYGIDRELLYLHMHFSIKAEYFKIDNIYFNLHRKLEK